MWRSALFATLLAATTAGAEERPANQLGEDDVLPGHRPVVHIQPQVQIDGGLSIIGGGYEHPVGEHVALQVEAGVFGSYFLPWFDLGDNVIGGIGGLRVTWFPRTDGRGLYVTPYVRAGYASGKHDDMDGSGPVVTAGAFVGYAFGLTQRLDLRVGLGAQYMYIGGDSGFGASTPFGAVDITLGYRL